ncbi:MAG TPA: hypothetical protein VJ797_15640 [Burkholderiales bacterium]|nr:hypothetical protein [Burkholderiales bacterium]
MRGGAGHLPGEVTLRAREHSRRGRRTKLWPQRRDEIRAALDAGPLTLKAISQRLNLEYRLVAFYLNPMIELGSVVVIGTARDAGIFDCHPHCKVVALPGTPPLARAPGPRVKHHYRPVAAPRGASAAPDEVAAGEFKVAGWRTIGRGLAGWGGRR